jgi:type I restriction enzyme S subunit
MLDEKRITGEHLVPYLRNIDVQWDRINVEDLPKMDVGPHEHERYLLRNGDLLVCEGGEVGRAAIWLNGLAECAYQKALHRLRPHDAGQDPRYLFYTLRFAVDRGVFEANGNPNTILHLTGQQFRTYRFPNPPADEQREVAAFLDRETAKIDALVAEQQRLIELLQEKRQAVISHAVTKGLNPDVPMKDSGEEWLGDVPAHWSVERMKLAVRSAKNGIWGDEARGNEDDIACVRVADFDRSQLRVLLTEPTIRNVPERERVGRVLRQGDLLIEKSGGGESQPVGCVVLYEDTETAVCSNFVARVELETGQDPSYWRFVHAAAYFARVNTKSIKQTSGIQNLDAQAYFDELGPFPPLIEQQDIVAHIALRTNEIDQLVYDTERAIDLLLERRAAIVTSAVTGQIDVRQLVSAEAA